MLLVASSLDLGSIFLGLEGIWGGFWEGLGGILGDFRLFWLILGY